MPTSEDNQNPAKAKDSFVGPTLPKNEHGKETVGQTITEFDLTKTHEAAEGQMTMMQSSMDMQGDVINILQSIDNEMSEMNASFLQYFEGEKLRKDKLSEKTGTGVKGKGEDDSETKSMWDKAREMIGMSGSKGGGKWGWVKWVIGAIGLAVWLYWDELKAFWKKTKEKVKEEYEEFVTNVKNQWNDFVHEEGGTMDRFWSTMDEFGTNIKNDYNRIIKASDDKIYAFGRDIKNAWDGFVHEEGGTMDKFWGSIDETFTNIKNDKDRLVKAYKKKKDEWTGKVKDSWNTFVHEEGGTMDKFWGTMDETFTNIKNSWKDISDTVTEQGEKILKSTIGEDATNQIKEFGKNIGSSWTTMVGNWKKRNP